MSTGFVPGREAELLPFLLNFKTKITASATTYGLTTAQATAFGVLNDVFVTAYNVANAPDTRSPANISSKDVAKAAVVANLRLLAGIVQRAPGTTNPMRIELGLPPRSSEPSPVPTPGFAPTLKVVSVSGRTAKIRLIDAENPTRRGKPAGALGASVFSHVGATAPLDLNGWTFEGNTGRTKLTLQFPDAAAGATVWLTAFWFNPSKRSGPACDPVSTNLPGGGVSMAA